MTTNRTRKATPMTTPASAPKVDVSKFAKIKPQDEDFAPTTRNRDIDYGPFPAWLAESKAANKGKALPVANEEEAKAVANLIRRAATHAGMGCQIQIVEDGGAWKVRFKGKDKRTHDASKPRKPVRKDAWDDATYAKALKDYLTAITAWMTENGQAAKVAPLTEKIRAEVRALAPKPAPAAKAS